MNDQPQNPAKVLIVEDEPFFQELLSHALREFDTRMSTDAESALRTVEQFSPDLVVLDVELPGGSGYDLCKAIRTSPAHRFTKIVFVSSHVELERRLHGYEIGGDDYITKPFSMDEVLAKVRVLTRLKTVEEISQIKRDFLSLMSHETLTPLTVIRSGCEMLMSEDELAAEQRQKCLRSIYSAGNRLIDLTEKILLACKLKETSALSLTTASVPSIIEEAVGEIETFASSIGIDLEQHVAAGQINAHRTYVVKAISYVLHNAVRFATAGGPVRIVGTADEKNYKISVFDNGPGLATEIIPHLFEPFAVKDILYHGQGSGLSLALCRQILDLHHGGLTVRNSTEATGTIAEFSFPLLATATSTTDQRTVH